MEINLNKKKNQVSSKVVLTGSYGYVGVATRELLENSGYTVIEIDKKIGRDTKYLFSYLIGEKPIAIIHLSALKSIPESKRNLCYITLITSYQRYLLLLLLRPCLYQWYLQAVQPSTAPLMPMPEQR